MGQASPVSRGCCANCRQSLQGSSPEDEIAPISLSGGKAHNLDEDARDSFDVTPLIVAGPVTPRIVAGPCVTNVSSPPVIPSKLPSFGTVSPLKLDRIAEHSEGFVEASRTTPRISPGPMKPGSGIGNVHSNVLLGSARASYFQQEVRELKSLELLPSTDRIGPFVFASGATYNGEWRGNTRHGSGRQDWLEGASYEGCWAEDKPHGRGRFTHENGDIYIGEWKAGAAHGCGVHYQNSQKTIYHGDWFMDSKDGFGVETWKNGTKYLGEFRRGEKQGHGTFIWPDGSVFNGGWVRDAIKGFGCYVASDGRSSKGGWRKSVLDGAGVSLWQHGVKYSGQYTLDRKDGFGIVYWPDGLKYQGFWLRGLRHGAGGFVSKNGAMTEAAFHNGRPMPRSDGSDMSHLDRNVPHEAEVIPQVSHSVAL